MANQPSRNPKRSGPRLRHHLEDEFDRVLDKLHGSGRAHRRQIERRDEQLRHRAHDLFEQVLQYELDEPALFGAQVEDIEVHPGAGLLTVFLAVDDEERVAPLATAIEARLRAELAQHLPRRHTARVKLQLLPLPYPGGGA